LAFLEEDDEWAAIYKYNKYLYEKEKEVLAEKKRKQIQNLRNDLDKQVKEKEFVKQRE
jgi:hypothetical protein